MIIVDELPFSFVEKEGFIEFIEIMCPNFVVPSRHTISRDCALLFLDEVIKLKEFFKKKTNLGLLKALKPKFRPFKHVKYFETDFQTLSQFSRAHISRTTQI